MSSLLFMVAICQSCYSPLSVVAVLVLFFVCVLPLGWLGVIIIVFLLLSSVCLIFGACVFIFLRGGVRFPNEVGVW